MGSESLSRRVDLFFAQEFSFFKQEHGPPSGSEHAKTDVLLTTVLGPLRRGGRQVAGIPLFVAKISVFHFYCLHAVDVTQPTGSGGVRRLTKVPTVP